MCGQPREGDCETPPNDRFPKQPVSSKFPTGFPIFKTLIMILIYKKKYFVFGFYSFRPRRLGFRVKVRPLCMKTGESPEYNGARLDIVRRVRARSAAKVGAGRV